MSRTTSLELWSCRLPHEVSMSEIFRAMSDLGLIRSTREIFAHWRATDMKPEDGLLAKSEPLARDQRIIMGMEQQIAILRADRDAAAAELDALSARCDRAELALATERGKLEKADELA